jgi:hypothetical protein
MEKKLGLAALLLLLLLVACGPPGNYDYPLKLSFGREGGTKICSGKEGFYDVSINDYNGNGETKLSKGENDTIIATCYWLTVKYKERFNNEMKIIAEPNTTGKKRTLYIYCMVDNNGADIKVTQSK